MGLRFQRRVRLLPGLHLNLSLFGVGVSVGGRGAHIGVTARGQRYTPASDCWARAFPGASTTNQRPRRLVAPAISVTASPAWRRCRVDGCRLPPPGAGSNTPATWPDAPDRMFTFRTGGRPARIGRHNCGSHAIGRPWTTRCINASFSSRLSALTEGARKKRAKKPI
jgi:hypothetical protein